MPNSILWCRTVLYTQCQHVDMTISGRRGKSPQHPVPILRPIHSCDTTGSILLPSESDVDTHGLVGIGSFLCLADHNLDDLSILTEVLIPPKSLQQILFTYARIEANDVYEILLHHP